MREDTDQAYRDGYQLGLKDETYRRDWPCPYITGAATWAMTYGYESAWSAKRNTKES